MPSLELAHKRMPYFGDDRVMACTEADMLRWLGELTGLRGLAFVDGAPTVEAGGFPLTIRAERRRRADSG
ncbi:MAG: hypothetical protein R3E48_06650 [Burkholderiaceae bacterium]